MGVDSRATPNHRVFLQTKTLRWTSDVNPSLFPAGRCRGAHTPKEAGCQPSRDASTFMPARKWRVLDLPPRPGPHLHSTIFKRALARRRNHCRVQTAIRNAKPMTMTEANHGTSMNHRVILVHHGSTPT